MFKTKFAPLRFFLFTFALVLPVASWAANPYQSRNMHFGVSGSNVKDITRAYCCGGTLGSLLSDGTTQYILSNNHILARQDRATPGENISQPGLIDNGCQPATIVADFTAAPKLGTNVDAAVAALRAGKMDSTGYIEGIGTISSVTKAPAVGLAVEKSGRTTGTTTGTINSVNTSVNVQYQIRCGQGKKYVISYTNQIVINGSGFSAGGDSGSLIVSNTSNCHQPVGLLYAGSSTDTIANPIGEVLNKVGTALGRSVNFVGSTCTSSPAQSAQATGAEGLQLPEQAVEHTSRVLEQHRHDLMSRPGVLGAGVGASESGNEAAVVVYVDNTAGAQPQLPAHVDGVPVKVHLTDPFVAF
ncbi:MAG TPA: hypothetical protein VFO30_06985 [Chthoniobacterales bacterium]|nr:hypothetical protein [Chthoniobacterales bacterium]